MKKFTFEVSKVSAQMPFRSRIDIESHLTLAAARTVLGITVNVVATAHQRASFVDGAGHVIAEENTFAIENSELGVDAVDNVGALNFEFSLLNLATGGKKMLFDILKFRITDKDRLMTAKAATCFTANRLRGVGFRVFDKEQSRIVSHLMANFIDNRERMFVLLLKLLDDFGSCFVLKLFCLLSYSAFQ